MAESEHFKLSTDPMLACPHCAVNGTQMELLIALEGLRTVVNRPIQIISGYRCPIHNKAVGGELKSQHMFGNAADIRIRGMSAAEIERAAETIASIEGIGRNDHESWVHVDVRDNKSRWCYSKERKAIPYYSPAVLA